MVKSKKVPKLMFVFLVVVLMFSSFSVLAKTLGQYPNFDLDGGGTLYCSKEDNAFWWLTSSERFYGKVQHNSAGSAGSVGFQFYHLVVNGPDQGVGLFTEYGSNPSLKSTSLVSCNGSY